MEELRPKHLPGLMAHNHINCGLNTRGVVVHAITNPLILPHLDFSQQIDGAF
jgi:hypothetical protein